MQLSRRTTIVSRLFMTVFVALICLVINFYFTLNLFCEGNVFTNLILSISLIYVILEGNVITKLHAFRRFVQYVIHEMKRSLIYSAQSSTLNMCAK